MTQGLLKKEVKKLHTAAAEDKQWSGVGQKINPGMKQWPTLGNLQDTTPSSFIPHWDER